MLLSTKKFLSVVFTSPYIIAHGTLIFPDVPSAVLAVTSVYFFWKWLKRLEMLEAFIAGIVLGLAELTKFTLLIFYPLFVAMWLLYRLPEIKTLTKNHWLQQTKQLVVMFVLSVLIIKTWDISLKERENVLVYTVFKQHY
jgi:4-amino-4-deoxy-L-arabinose transferase-like glycosyltransferase